MPHPCTTRSEMQLDAADECDASSSIAPSSPSDAPMPYFSDLPDDIPFMRMDADALLDDEVNDPSFRARRDYATRLSDEEKAIELLGYLKDHFNGRFSLRKFLNTLYTSLSISITAFADSLWNHRVSHPAGRSPLLAANAFHWASLSGFDDLMALIVSLNANADWRLRPQLFKAYGV